MAPSIDSDTASLDQDPGTIHNHLREIDHLLGAKEAKMKLVSWCCFCKGTTRFVNGNCTTDPCEHPRCYKCRKIDTLGRQSITVELGETQ